MWKNVPPSSCLWGLHTAVSKDWLRTRTLQKAVSSPAAVCGADGGSIPSVRAGWILGAEPSTEPRIPGSGSDGPEISLAVCPLVAQHSTSGNSEGKRTVFLSFREQKNSSFSR